MNDIRSALQQSDSMAEPHNLPTAAEVWSRLQFRLAYQPPRLRYLSEAGTLLPALYVLVFVIWATTSVCSGATLLAVLASAAVAAVFLALRASRFLRS